MKVGNYDHVLFYTKVVLDKDQNNFKALYRRGIAYCRLGETKRSHEILTQAYNLPNLSPGDKNIIREGLAEIKAKRDQHKKNELELAQRMVPVPAIKEVKEAPVKAKLIEES